MKKVTILLFAATLFLHVFSSGQFIELSFTGQEETTTGTVTPDSVYILNQTRGVEALLTGNDITIRLNLIAGINEELQAEKPFELQQNYPNPFRDQTTFSIYVFRSEELVILLSDVYGQKLAVLKGTFDRGTHFFKLAGNQSKFYLLTVLGQNHSSSIKLLSSHLSEDSKHSIEYAGKQPLDPYYKATFAENTLPYSFGEKLLFVGYARGYEFSLIEDSPVTSTHYIFLFGFPNTSATGAKCCPSTITYQGQEYETVAIGEQCWMAENLNVGTMINGTTNMAENGIIEKHCYGDDPLNCDEYGALYQWNEVMNYSTSQGVQGICPPGWHVPTDKDWKKLEGAADSQFGYPDPEWNQNFYRGFDAGLNIKSTIGWINNGNGLDLYNLSALPAGFYYRGGGDDAFMKLNTDAYFWTSSMLFGYNPLPWYRRFNKERDKIRRTDIGQGYASSMSVRCIKGTYIVKPYIFTRSVTITSNTSADVGGEIINLGGPEVIEHGHCWSVNPNPTISNDHTELGSTTEIGEFTSNLLGLNAESFYYVRAYATNDNGTAYGDEVVFQTLPEPVPCPGLPTLLYEGQVYTTVLIGEQCWLREKERSL